MRFAAFTDVHFGPAASFEGKLRKLSHHAGALVADVIERLNRDEHPELVVNLGDVVEDESRDADRARYAELVALGAQLDAPLVHVAGNHDSVHLDDDDLRALWRHEGELFRSWDAGGVHFAALRSVERKDRDVRLPREQVDWLADDLRRAAWPSVVLVHHPLGELDLAANRWFARAPHLCRIAERREVRGVIEASGKVALVLNGHAHWNHLDVCGGIPYVTLQSVVENLDEDAPGRPARAYAVVDLTPRRVLVRVGGEEPARYQVELAPR
ncbi:MAG: metallophosphoesterase [Polyangiaceae bacterium]|nr:metallophosphoesterase [Polyangiaceae bacterium]